ncbi:hypothetical protein [Hymenobacter nivis]|uniref:Uncharacterized protein n=1 Tax=Hymenobacter nivis TaxID=1850093 RepID=A0A502HCF4_9BACT|nr:hypothetical protein [Hymenobacter nivis]TPG71714.1 hypothetical protein EAH73_00180 [Hymenobacter nivis]
MDSPTPTAAFDKARTGLWTSLQKHLATVYAAEAAYRQAVAFAPDVPFAAADATDDQLDAYHKQRSALRDLFADETTQLDQLTKAIRTKGYAADEKKQLYVLLLGYVDIAASVFALLDSHAPSALAPDEELAETKARFDRVKNFARLNVKGVAGLLTSL